MRTAPYMMVGGGVYPWVEFHMDSLGAQYMGIYRTAKNIDQIHNRIPTGKVSLNHIWFEVHQQSRQYLSTYLVLVRFTV